MAASTNLGPNQGGIKRQLSAIEMAMLADIGAKVQDELPTDDHSGGRRGRGIDLAFQPQHTAIVTRESRQSTAAQPAVTSGAAIWRGAIDSGNFNDDDAQVVAGLDQIANGNLARARRQGAAGVAQDIMNATLNPNNLRRNELGLIPPRATPYNPKLHRPSSNPGASHVGNGPVQIGGRNHPTPPGASVSRPIVQQQRDPNVNTGTSSGRPTTSGPRAAQTVAKPVTRLPSTVPAAAPTQPQRDKIRFPHPEEDLIIFQKGINIMPTGLRQMVPATIYLVDASVSTKAVITIIVNSEAIDDEQWSIEVYEDFKTFEGKGLALSFKTDGGRLVWFVVDFRSRDEVVAFVEALRKLKKSSLEPPSTTPAIKQEPPVVEQVVTEKEPNPAAPTSSIVKAEASPDIKAEPLDLSKAMEPLSISSLPVNKTEVPPASESSAPGQPMDGGNVSESRKTETTRIGKTSDGPDDNEPDGNDGPDGKDGSKNDDGAEEEDANEALKKELIAFMVNTVAVMRESSKRALIDDAALSTLVPTMVASYLSNTSRTFRGLEKSVKDGIVDFYYDMVIVEFLRRASLSPVPGPVQPADRLKQSINSSEPSPKSGPVKKQTTRIEWTHEQLMQMRADAVDPPRYLQYIDFPTNKEQTTHHHKASAPKRTVPRGLSASRWAN